MESGNMSLKMHNNSLRYSNDKLIKLYGIDLFAAVSSGAMVSPFIAIVDRSIIENLNGKRKLMDGLKFGIRSLTAQPFQFITSRQFRIVLGLYFATYATANIVETTCEQHNVDSSKSSMYKFVSTSLANILVCVYKDRVFARMFGVATSRSFPKLSYLLFTIRDSLTIAASFTAPAYIASMLQNNSLVTTEKTANATAQLLCPAAIQFVSTPIHLLALDLYNRPNATIGLRSQLLGKEYLKSTVARIGRIGPAFGFGGIGNAYIRNFRNNL